MQLSLRPRIQADGCWNGSTPRRCRGRITHASVAAATTPPMPTKGIRRLRTGGYPQSRHRTHEPYQAFHLRFSPVQDRARVAPKKGWENTVVPCGMYARLHERKNKSIA